jgi:hypothetical protein
MQAVPSHDALIASINQLFALETADGQRVHARLVEAPAGIAMDASYVCYLATFELPAGIWLPQDTYRITAPDGSSWDLLVTPTRPSPNGQANLTAVMHYQRSVEPSSTTT